jgi:hypothetical protein
MIKIPSIRFVVRSALNDALGVFRRLSSLALIAFSIYCGDELLQLTMLPDGPTRKMFLTALDATTTLLIVPFDIAVYRLIVLGEVTSRYAVATGTSRFRRFLAWTAVFWLIGEVPSYAGNILSLSDGAAAVLESGFTGISIFLGLRLILIFPAIAVDSPAATAADSFADTKGHFWFLFRAMLLVFLPLTAVVASMVILAQNGLVSDISNLSFLSGFPRAIFIGFAEFATTTLSLVVASRLFEWLGGRVQGPPVSRS